MSAIDVQTRLRTPEQNVFTVAEKGRLEQERDRLLEETRRLEERNRELLEESEYLARLMEKREMLRDGKIKLKRFALKKNPLETPSGAIAKLPARLLERIFVVVCSRGSNFSPYQNPKFDLPPLQLAHVSRAWRKVAFSQDGLWATFQLDLSRCNLDLLRFFLTRSGCVPLSLRCECQAVKTRPYLIDRNIMDPLLQHSFRWRSAILDFEDPLGWHKYIRSLRNRYTWPILESIDLRWPSDQRTFNPIHKLVKPYAFLEQLFKLFPEKLRAVSFGNYAIYRPPPIIYSDQIRSYTFNEPVSQLDYLRILVYFTMLKEVYIPEYLLTFSHLITLHIKRPILSKTISTVKIQLPEPNGEQISMYLFFKVVCLPALRNLAVSGPRYAAEAKVSSNHWDSNAYRRFVFSPFGQSHIEHLSLRNLKLRTTQIRDILSFSHSLRHFEFYECESVEVTRYLVNLLTPKPTSIIALPNLMGLGVAFELPSLAQVDLENTMAKEVVEMVKARGQECLPSVRLTFRLRRPFQVSTRNILRHGIVLHSVVLDD
ncbi:hypothetical protein VNI00_008490 [Paramarasmius palmivorus]|uniref:F-box domain-containing protein n=1 Tax=Paramarasmius palmivorus TaxID=297713 RepID=A0AAW0CW77_9AGAR